jgi:hypothetical protein
MTEDMVPIVMFISVAVVVIAAYRFRYRARDGVQQTSSIALDKGPDLSPELNDRLGHPKAPKNKDFRLAILWLAMAVGLVLIAFVIPEPEAFRGILAGAAFPFTIGIAYLILQKFANRD